MAKTFTLDDVIRRAAVKSACSEDQARQVITAGLRLLRKHGASNAISALFSRLPGAESVALSIGDAKAPRSGLFSSLPIAYRGLPLAVATDGAALLVRFKLEGIDRTTAKRLTRSVQSQIEAETGEDLLGDALRSIPGVGEILGR